MPGFTAHLADILGEVTTDWYGNPLCTTYRPTTAPGRTGYELDAEGHPIILVKGGQCVSNMAGEITIPNLGPDRYAMTVLAPAKTVVTPPGLQPTCRNKGWVKTTTLEGGPGLGRLAPGGRHGLRHRVPALGRGNAVDDRGLRLPARRAEREPQHRRHRDRPRPQGPGLLAHRRAACPTTAPSGAATPARRPTGRSTGPGSRSRACRLATSPPPSCSGNADGTFTIPRVPPGDYMISIWDEPLNEPLDTYNVTVRRRPGLRHRRRHARPAGSPRSRARSSTTSTRTAARTLASPASRASRSRSRAASTRSGSGIADLPDRHRAATTASTRRIRSTCSTSSRPTTTAGRPHGRHLPGRQPADADDGARRRRRRQLPAHDRPLGSARLGRQALCAGRERRHRRHRHLRHDSQRARPRLRRRPRTTSPASRASRSTSSSPSPAPAPHRRPAAPRTATCSPPTAPTRSATGSTATRPSRGSSRRTASPAASTATPLVGEQALPRTTDPLGNPVNCLEAPMMGVQFGGDDPFNSPNPDANYFSSVDGNYGFGDGWTTPGARLPDGSPDPAQSGLRLGAADAGRLHRQGRDPERPDPGPPALHADARRGRQRLHRRLVQAGAIRRRPASARCTRCTSRTRTSSTRAAARSRARRGRSATPSSCRVRDGKSIAPTFELFTDVPVPAKFWGLVNDNLNVSIDPEVDALRRDRRHRQRAGRHLRLHRPPRRHARTPTRTASSRSLLPSTSTYNCPLPAGPCPNMYRVVGNDPGQPSAPQPRLPPRVRHDLGELPGLARADAAGRHGQHRRRHARCSRRARTSPSRCSA